MFFFNFYIYYFQTSSDKELIIKTMFFLNKILFTNKFYR